MKKYIKSSSDWMNKDGYECRPVYMINGWEYGREYFLSFGFNDASRRDLYHGDIITRGDNEFYIIVEDKDGHSYDDCSEFFEYDEVF